ncbi:hypothetical protein COY61_01925 [bacterium (Candidatus Gribaldobacteria) CG_4_10_14_0_8_um_filter_33_9]|uniref:Uncharacterized protein n=1 Tax=bacterium (Candidatus Gribaldobacteria) CG_4_10_14_0_8_um_filter_33_9 TaxID=2014266 RepID=A0A2M7RMH5_9BACT|nr:MAG: hypothetical protein COY61_01925 [bacterium (Candidatus Gribaldobacteria) CG_4_10_14_0_8_um_filter_33_9]
MNIKNIANIKSIVSVMLVLILGVGIGLLATKTWNPSWNPFVNASSQIIEKAIAKSFQAKTYKIEEDIKLKITPENGQNGDFSFFISGVVDQTDLENVKTDSDLVFKMTGEGVEIQAKGKAKTFGKDIYFQITTLPSLPFLPAEIIAGFKNQWIKIDKKKLEEMFPSSETSLETSFDQQAFVEEIKPLLKGIEIFKIEKNLGEENLDGVKAQHYLVSFKKETIKALIPEILRVVKKYQPEAQSESESENEFEKIQKAFDDKFEATWQKISPLKIDFWLEKGNVWLKKIKIEKEINVADFDPDSKTKGKINFVLEMKIFDFNKEVKIEMPQNYKGIEEILSSMMGAILPKTGNVSGSEEILPQIPNFNEEK